MVWPMKRNYAGRLAFHDFPMQGYRMLTAGRRNLLSPNKEKYGSEHK
jgi:hypothetical protein